MRIRTRLMFHPLLLGLVIALVSSFSAVRAQAPAVTPPDNSADLELAARFAELSQSNLRVKVILPAHFKLAAALLHACHLLSPDDPRYPLLEAEAWLEIKDVDRSIDAYHTYMSIPGYGDDRVAQAAYIRLQAGKMETTDAKLNYLSPLIASEKLAPEVRSQAAMLAVGVLQAKGDDAQALVMLDQAIKLDPLNLPALRMHYQLVDASGSITDRVSTLLGMLRSNPAQFTVIQTLAEQIANAGMVDGALQFYALGADLAANSNTGVPSDFATAYGYELFLANQPQALQQILDSLLKNDPSNYQVLALQLLVLRSTNNQAEIDKVLPQAQNSLFNSLATIRQRLGDTGATTRPVAEPSAPDWGDLNEDMKRVNQTSNDQLKSAYVSTLCEIAWLELYFGHRPAEAAPFIQALTKLLPEESPVLARLEGWSYLVSDQKEQARVKLSAAAAGKDSLAALGLIKLAANTPQEQDKATADGAKLLAEHPSGTVAAILFEALRDRGVTVTPSPEAQAIQTALAQFPKEWLGIIQQPQNYYEIRASPVRVSHTYGEPIFATVTIRNIGNYDITIGPEGILRPDLWFDAQMRGLVEDTIPGVCIERLSQQMILRQGKAITQVMRLDQGKLSGFLAGSPAPGYQIMFSVRTNPTTTSRTGALPGGYGVNFDKMVERAGFSSNDIPQLINEIRSGPGAKQIRDMDLGITLVGILSNKSNSQNPKAQQVAAALVEAIHSRFTAPSPSVRGWAQFIIAERIPVPDQRTAAIDRMMNDPNWQERMLGLTAMGALPLDQQLNISRRTADSDIDPTVKQYAEACEELVQAALESATTQPADSGANK